MDRSQEKVPSSQAKLQTLDQSANIHQKVGENQAGVNRVAQRKISSDSSAESFPFVDGRNGNEGVNNRKHEPSIASLQAQYFHSVTNAASAMNLPYLSNPNMERAGNFFYGYSPQLTGFPGYPAGYGPRITNGEEPRENRSSTSNPSDRSESGRDSKEPVRTESVIKIATERADSRKSDPVDKRASRNEDYSRHYPERNGDIDASRHVTSYRGSRDKPEVTSNGDIRNSKQMHEGSTSERILGAFNSYQTPSMHAKVMNPAPYVGDYIHSGPKPDYAKTTSTSSGAFASMPKLTSIAPRFPTPAFSMAPTAAEISNRHSITGPVWRPSNIPYHTSREYLSSTSESVTSHRNAVERETSNRADEINETLRASYHAHSSYDNNAQENAAAARERLFPYGWDRPADLSCYQGHSAYQGFGYGRTFQPKRPDDKENVKEPEEIRNRSESLKESAISTDRSVRYIKESFKGSGDTAKNHKEHASQNYKAAIPSHYDAPARNQVTLNKSEKPVLPENVRYKVNDERKGALKSDKVTVYPKQGMAYAVSVRETPQKVSDYFSNGRTPNADIPLLGNDSNDRSQLPVVYEPAIKKEEGQRLGYKDASGKARDRSHGKNASSENGDKYKENVTGSEYLRRRYDSKGNDKNGITNAVDSKKNDRNNNSSFATYQYPGFANQGERSRAPNRITLGQDKVFVPPNATLEMFEKRELEMERAAQSCRAPEATRVAQFAGSNGRPKTSGRKESDPDSRNHSPEQTILKPVTNKAEVVRSEVSSRSSDDEELKIIEEKAASQPRTGRADEKRLSSSPSRHSRITSPATSTSTATTNPPYLTPFGANFPARRTPAENEAAARENAERNLQATYMYGANLPYQTSSQFLGGSGRAEVPVMLPVDPSVFYSGLYKSSHMMDPAQGGAVMQDPLTGSLVVVPAEALMNPNMFSMLGAPESQLMLDQQLQRFYGMEDPRWQQLYQIQQKQLYDQMEKYKLHDMMMAQQQGRWPGYSMHPFYQKQLEAQKKQEESDRNSREQITKSREEQTSQPRSEKNQETNHKEKQTISVDERVSSVRDSRREEMDSRQDGSKSRQDQQSDPRMPAYPERQEQGRENNKAPSVEFSEGRDKVKENIQQDEKDRQFKQYMLRDPKFPFSRIPTSLSSTKPQTDIPRDRPRDLRETSRESTLIAEASNPEVSPQVVSAAATLANMDFGTRFPFGPQSIKQAEKESVTVVEQGDGGNRRTMVHNVLREEHAARQRTSTSEISPTDNRVLFSTSNASTPPFSSTKVAQSWVPMVTKVNDTNKTTDRFSVEKSNLGSHSKEAIRTKHDSSIQNNENSDHHSYSEDEGSRLLVARAEKLPQDEELTVVRIDTPYAYPSANKEAQSVSAERKQEMDLLMSLSKGSKDPLESPSSKSEIFWVEGSEGEEDFEVRDINSGVRQIKIEFEGSNKENDFMLTLQNTKTEEEKEQIKEKIEKLREVAKGRTREERFTALTRQKDLRRHFDMFFCSPSSIVNNVTTSLNEKLDMNVMEKDIRMRLADLQKKYREKHRELARLQPKGKDGNDDGGKHTPVKRGPGRPRKRKYFGAGSRSGKTTPILTSNGSLDSFNKSGGSSPSSCPLSPSLKSITSEENLIIKDIVEPIKKRKKKSSVDKGDDVSSIVQQMSSSPSPSMRSPTELEIKPARAKTSKKSTSTTVKLKNSSSPTTSSTASTNSSNMAKLISAITPSMFGDVSNIETANESNTSGFRPIAVISKPTKKKKKAVNPEKLSSTDECLEDGVTISPDVAKITSESLTSVTAKKVKNQNKKKKRTKPPITPKNKFEFVFPVTGETVEDKSTVKTKDVSKPETTKKERQSNGESSENDDVFTTCQNGGALDMLANFASSASFEKEKKSEKEPTFEELSGKSSKRGKQKKQGSSKQGSPEPESELSPKKKKKKRKPSSSSSKSSKKSSVASEEKENEILKPELVEQLPMQILLEKVEQKEEFKPEPVQEEHVEKVLEVVEHVEEEETESLNEQDPTLSEKRRKSRSSSLADESKQAFALFGDWQPRRSERIFINSSVAPPSTADSSPLSSPTAKTSEFGWPKKCKKLCKGKKLSKSDSVSDAEPTEEESPVPGTPPNLVVKPKKKRSPGKGKKRRSSSVTDPDFVLRTPKRKSSKRDRSYEETEEDEDEDMDEDEEYHDDDVEDFQELVKENTDETLLDKTNENPNSNLDPLSIPCEKLKGMEIINRESRDEKSKLNVKETEVLVNMSEVAASIHETNNKNDLLADGAVLAKMEEVTRGGIFTEEDIKVSPAKVVHEGRNGERMEDDQETKDFSKKEQINATEVKKERCIKPEEIPTAKNEPISASPKADQSSSNEETSKPKIELPPEPVISFTREELKDSTKMLLPVDRVFFRGRIAFYQDPDLYGIVLPGERGRRPHLRSTEQLLSQAVKDVIPSAVEYLPVGTRVCAHWSPQYRCFYPGSVIETPLDEKSEIGKLWVEFDDGDSGIFPLSDLRKIKTQYPVQVDDVESDVIVTGRQRSSSRATSPLTSRRSREQDASLKTKDDDTSGWDSTEDAPVRRSRGRGKRRVKLRTRERRLSGGEATDSDAPRGNRDSDYEEHTESTKRENTRSNMNENVDKDYIRTESKGSSQQKGVKKVRKRTKNREDLEMCPREKAETAAKDVKTDVKTDVKQEKTAPKKESNKSKSFTEVQKQQEEDDDDEGDDTDTRTTSQEQEAIRLRSKSSRLSELDLRKKSLTLNLNSSPRSGTAERDSPMQDSTSQDDDSGSCSEVFDESPQTENTIFQPRLGKRRRSQLDKLRQDKSSSELWQWSGKNFQNKRKGKGRKVFYKTIVRGEENISVGDCAVFTSNPSKSNNLPYVGKIESMWEGCSGNMVVRVKWFYHPEETKAGRRASDAKNSLYRSTHVDENDVQTISHKCEVVSPEELKKRTQPQDTIGTRSTTSDRSERVFCCVGTYDPSTEKIETS